MPHASVLRRTAAAIAVSAGLVAGALTTTGAASATAPAGGPRPAAQQLPQIFPTPRQITAGGDRLTVTPEVAVVAGSDADASALSVAEAALKASGAQRFVRTTADRARALPGDLALFLGGADQDGALSAIGLPGTGGLPAQGYELGAARNRVVLAGSDPDGQFYAAQTLRQVLHSSREFAGLSVRDWPSTPLRGTIEGFYGTPWSDQARLDQLDFYAAHKMNVYVYSPKDDPYLRAQWRDPYPADKLAAIKKLVDRATADHVAFTYALSPGLSVCYSSAADEQALTGKLQSLWDIGVRSFAIPLDDISYTTWNCDADKARWGTGGGAAGQAQAYLLNQVQKDFIDTHPGAQPLEMVPTEYSNTTPSPYKSAIAGQLDPRVLVEWTGEAVVPGSITTAQTQQAAQVFGHRILIWDNYPVNDYTTSRLLLAPYTGREPGVTGAIAGLTANPMIQPYASKIALFTAADYLWNSTGYDPQRSWTASLSELAGGDPATTAALRTFADLEYTSVLDRRQAPELAAAIARFWADWQSRPAQAVAALYPHLAAVAQAPARLRAGLPKAGESGFLTDAAPWLDATRDWGNALTTALDLLARQRAGDTRGAWADRQRLPGLVSAARSHTYTGLSGSSVKVEVGDGVVDAFVDRAISGYDSSLGVVPQQALPTTSLSPYQTYAAANYTDGDPATYFWSDAAPAVGDYVGVDLGTARPISDVDVTMAKSGSPNDYIHHGTLEYSADGTGWHPLGDFTDAPEVKATAPAGTTARYVRLRVTAAQDYWVVVDEFAVHSTLAAPVVSGSPAAAAGSSLAAAGDGDLDTAYRAASAPAPGDALTMTLPQGRPLDSLTVLQPGNGGARAAVEIQLADGGWRTVGQLGGPVSTLPAGGAAATAVRLVWDAGSPAPSVSEILPRYQG
ncbi:beta-N-acetylglucosaminidase domain-containing protein [Phaeacidiphilus oryzae]|uniref:beta-N-acetylglucosaminidase domain-containing protein n=1 Tax=Phaeacidiphilus oryzae TaxID=348818 RepID=UPI00056ACA05|nr:beta-N-acetylglucosaminidase domain-containing protein [Phaeacidiphilus oryzae]